MTTRIEGSFNQPAETASSSTSLGDVLSEYAASTWKAGVARPLTGLAQLVDPTVKSHEPERNLTGMMKAANIAGEATGTLADIILLSRFVGKGVTALGEKHAIQPLVENGLTKSMTVSGTTGFIDGFAFNPQKNGEGLGNRFAHGLAEAGGFMALDGSTRFMAARLGENAISKYISRAGSTTTTAFNDFAPAWASEAGRNAAGFLTRKAENLGVNKLGETITSRFPTLTGENMTRNAISGLIGGEVYYSADTILNGKQLNLSDAASTGFGWAAGNAVLGGKAGFKPEPKVEVKAPEPVVEKVNEPAPGDKGKDIPPPPPTYKAETKVLENGDQQWTYRDIPNKGDTTTYTKNQGPLLEWQIKTADGRVFDRSTPGPWEVKYPDGSALIKNEHNYLSFSKPISVEIGGNQLAVREVTQLQADQKAIGKQWVYQDPAVPNQTVTFNADRSWEAVGADGKSFSFRSDGPWKVTNLDGYVEMRAKGSSDIDVQHLAGHSNWRDFRGAEPGTPQALDARKPRAFKMAADDMSPMSLSENPRNMDISGDKEIF